MNNNLSLYGWNDRLFQLKQSSPFHSLIHGRVAVVHKTCYDVISEEGIYQCELTGNMLFGKPEYELPCTGDWVIFQPFDESKGIIVDRLPRERTLCRRKSGTVAGRQVIASYVDKAFIVQSLDGNFNVRRAERFMAQVLEEGIQPVLVLNKVDLDDSLRKMEEAIKHFSGRVQVFMTSLHQSDTILSLREFIAQGETVVFVGSSGVGKSSLINALCGRDILRTSEISESTGKGRHTSTRREMVLMESSGVLIDTPGVREFGLALDNPEILAEMSGVSDYIELCRFADCTHTNEPGCAVIQAVNDGSLSRDVYESYLKLRREAWHFTTAEHEKRKRDKSFSRIVDEVKKLKENR